MTFTFVATNNFDRTRFDDIEKFVDAYPGCQNVQLNDQNEFRLLLKLMEITDPDSVELDSPYCSQYWDLSSFALPEYSEEQFDRFYANWIKQSGRENTMDEYGQLIFLQGVSSAWNKLTFRMVVQMRSEPT